MRFTLIISLLISLLAVIFALQNPEIIPIEFGPFDVEGSTALVLLITFALGVFVGILFMLPSRLKSRKKVKTLKRQTQQEPAPTGEDTSTADVPAENRSL